MSSVTLPILLELREESAKDIRSEEVFVDKTMFVRSVLSTSGRRLLITAPKFFGKTRNLNLLEEFLSINRIIHYNIFFRRSRIHTKDSDDFYEENYHKHPVLNLNFTYFNKGDYTSALHSYRYAIHKAYMKNIYLLKSRWLRDDERELMDTWCKIKNGYKTLDEQHVVNDLVHLVRMIKRHYNQKVILLIDEYDSIVNYSLAKQIDDDEFKNILNLTESILKKLLKGNKDVSYAVLTGASCVTTRGLSEIDNLRIFPFLEEHRFGEYFGFTENDVTALRLHRGAAAVSRLRVTEDLTRYFSKSGYYIYNPYTIMALVECRNAVSYSLSTEHIEKVMELIRYPELVHSFDKILRNSEFFINFTSKPLLQDVIDLRNTYIFSCTERVRELNIDVLFSYFLECGVLSYKDAATHTPESDDEPRFPIQMPDKNSYELLRKEFQYAMIDICRLYSDFMSETHEQFMEKLNSSDNAIWIHHYNGPHVPRQ